MGSLGSRFVDAYKSLIGQSIYADAVPPVGTMSEGDIEAIRMQLGGQLQRLPQTQTQWFLANLEDAWASADTGNMQRIGQLWRAMKRDGYIGGLTQTRTAGLVALPRRYRGDQKQIDLLKAENGTRTIFEEMFPPSELALMAGDGLGLGVAVAEVVKVVGRDYPVMQRLDPEWLWYKWSEGRWYYQSVAGLLPITPGDGHWILHTPGGRVAPWQMGLWPSLGRAYVIKEHAILMRNNFSSKLANPARVAFTPLAASEAAKTGFLQRLIQWGINSVFELPAGWDVKLLESNGIGWEVFGKEIESSNEEIMIALAGQVVTVTGGTGFANASIHSTIRADLIKHTGDALAHTINTQGLPPWIYQQFGPEGLKKPVRVEWDIAPPADRKADADVFTSVAAAITSLRPVLAAGGITLDTNEIVQRFGVPLLPGKPPEIVEPAVEAAAAGAEPPNDTDSGTQD